MSLFKKDKKWDPTESEIGIVYNPRNISLVVKFIDDLVKSRIWYEYSDDRSQFDLRFIFKFKTKDKFLVNNCYRKVFGYDFYNKQEVRKLKLEHLENLKLK